MNHIPPTLKAWRTNNGEMLSISEMSRDVARDAMQWCLLNDDTNSSAGGRYIKGGFFINEWIVALTVRLLDPACE